MTIPETGTYIIDFRCANGNIANKSAIRSLKKDDDFLGIVVLPQRGVDEWSDWEFTNTVEVKLEKGSHKIELTFESANENMNVEINQVMIDYLRVTNIRQFRTE